MISTTQSIENWRSWPPEAKEHLLRRLQSINNSDALERPRTSLLSFIQSVNEVYVPQWFHVVLCQFLDRLASGEIDRAMVWMPPQHGKSEVVSRSLPPYMLGRNPDTKIIHTSYAAELVQGMNREVQRIMEREAYQEVFPDARLNSKNIRTVSGSFLRNNDIFEIVGRRGQYRCAGVGGGISGFPADIGILDDLYKDYKEAISATVRRAVWEWYTSTFLSRTHAKSRIGFCTTRWHPLDTSGELIEREGDAYHGGRWYILRLPALCEDPGDEAARLAFALNCKVEDLPHRRVEGEALWEGRFPRELLMERKKLNPHQFDALYQQTPKNREGALFNRDQFKKVSVIPADAERAIWWDLASSTDGDWTVGVLMARYEGRCGIEEVIRFRKPTHERNKDIMNTARRHANRYGNRVKIYIPKDGSGEASDYLVQLLAGYKIEAHREKGSKAERAEPFADQVQAGNVDYLEADWNDDYLEELEAFTGQGDTYDDQVDASANVFNRLTLAENSSFRMRTF